MNGRWAWTAAAPVISVAVLVPFLPFLDLPLALDAFVWAAACPAGVAIRTTFAPAGAVTLNTFAETAP